MRDYERIQIFSFSIVFFFSLFSMNKTRTGSFLCYGKILLHENCFFTLFSVHSWCVLTNGEIFSSLKRPTGWTRRSKIARLKACQTCIIIRIHQRTAEAIFIYSIEEFYYKFIFYVWNLLEVWGEKFEKL